MALHPYARLFTLPAPPDSDNDETEGYEIGDVVHVSGGSIYDCRDASTGAAVWEERSGGGSVDWGDIGGDLADQADLVSEFTTLNTVLDGLSAALDDHDHVGGDGSQIDHGGLAGLADDDHTQYIRHALATAVNDFLVASGAGVFVKKTLAETITILRTSLDSIFAPIAKGVTNGDSHNHNGGDGADLFYKDELGMWINGTVAASTTLYGAPYKPALDASTVNWPMTEAGTLSNLTVRKSSGGAQPATGSLQITILVNNVASILSVSFTNGDGAGGLTKTDTDEVAVSAGDQVRIEVKNNASSTSASIVGVSFTVEKAVIP